MKKLTAYLMPLLMAVMVAGCSDDEKDVVVSDRSIVGEWMASHHSVNPNYGDTADMWNFTFHADGTGTGSPFPATGAFKYEIDGNHITLRLMNTEAYYGRIVFEFKVVSISKDMMEWEEIPDKDWSDNSLYLIFRRKLYL